MTLVKMVRQTLFRTIAIGVVTTAMEFQLQIQGKVGIYSPGTEWEGLVDGKLRRR